MGASRPQLEGVHDIQGLGVLVDKHAILEESSKGHGEASTLQEAFEISLEDWLNKNRILLKELIAAVAQK